MCLVLRRSATPGILARIFLHRCECAPVAAGVVGSGRSLHPATQSRARLEFLSQHRAWRAAHLQLLIGVPACMRAYVRFRLHLALPVGSPRWLGRALSALVRSHFLLVGEAQCVLMLVVLLWLQGRLAKLGHIRGPVVVSQTSIALIFQLVHPVLFVTLSPALGTLEPVLGSRRWIFGSVC